MNTNRWLGAVYDGVDDDAAWPQVLRGLAELTGSRSAGLFRVEGAGLGYEQSWNMPADFMASFADTVGADPRVERALTHPLGSILSDAEPDIRQRMIGTGVDALVRGHDLPFTLSSLFRKDASGLWCLYVSRSSREGEPGSEEIARFGFALAHVQRAVSLRMQLAEAELRLKAAAIGSQASTRTAVLIDPDRVICWAEPKSEPLLRAGKQFRVRQGCLQLGCPRMNRALQRCMQRVATGLQAPLLTFPVDTPTTPPHVQSIEVLPWRGGGWLAADSPMYLISIQLQSELVQPSPLSPRQQEVLELLAEGLRNRQIADHMCVSVNTVRNHVQNLFDALGARNRTAVVAAARRRGWLAAGPD